MPLEAAEAKWLAFPWEDNSRKKPRVERAG